MQLRRFWLPICRRQSAVVPAVAVADPAALAPHHGMVGGVGKAVGLRRRSRHAGRFESIQVRFIIRRLQPVVLGGKRPELRPHTLPGRLLPIALPDPLFSSPAAALLRKVHGTRAGEGVGLVGLVGFCPGRQRAPARQRRRRFDQGDLKPGKKRGYPVQSARNRSACQRTPRAPCGHGLDVGTH